MQKLDLSQKISVVIITRNRIDSLARVLTEFSNLAEKFPIVVVDNQSTDATVATVREKFPEVKLVTLKKNMAALGRNIGVEHTDTPYIAFADDDSWWGEGSLAKAVQYFEEYPDVGVITGKILVNDQHKLDRTSALQSISPLPSMVEMPGTPILGFLGCALIVRREAYIQAGGYHKSIYFSGEEEILGYDIAASGWGMTYCDDVIGYHYPSPVRDLPSRYRLGSRNIVLRAWMRRPVLQAIKKTFQIEFHHPGAIYDAIGMVQGILSIPKILRHRRVVPWWLEDQIRLLEEQNEYLARKATQKQKEFAKSLQLEVG